MIDDALPYAGRELFFECVWEDANPKNMFCSLVCCFVLLVPTWLLYRVPRVSPGVTAPNLRLLPSLMMNSVFIAKATGTAIRVSGRVSRGHPHPNRFRLLPSLATPVPPSSLQTTPDVPVLLSEGQSGVQHLLGLIRGVRSRSKALA